jgi:hypothetical protein
VTHPIEPLRISFEVACRPEHAFMVWTSRIGAWWPADHTASGSPQASVVLEPHLGGRIYERAPSGEEVEWGEVTDWQPPHRFGYLWHLRRDRADATDVVISFVPAGAGTRVEIVHSGWERLGSKGRTWRDANHGGWSTLLPHYQAAVLEA